MAKKETMQVDVYRVIDKDGNPVKNENGEDVILKFPQGGSLFQEARQAKQQGLSYQTYMPNAEGHEVWEPASSATLDINIDPVKNSITVTGPKWLADQVTESEAFKKQYSDNSSLKQLMNIYAKDANATIPTNDGGEIYVGEALQEYQKAAESFASDFAKVATEREQIRQAFGITLNDEELSIANAVYSKEGPLGSPTYTDKDRIYIPKSYLEGDDSWEKALSNFESWDENTKSISAKDFYEGFYKAQYWINGSEDSTEVAGAIDFEKNAKNAIDNLKEYGSYDRSDPDAVKAHEALESDPVFRDEVARMLAFYRNVASNKPELSIPLKTTLAINGAIDKFTSGCGQLGYNFTSEVTGLFDNTLGQVAPKQIEWWNPVYTGAFVMGEYLSFMQEVREGATFQTRSGKEVTDTRNFGERFKDDWDVAFGSAEGTYSAGLKNRRDEFVAVFDTLSEQGNDLSSWYTVGEVIGYLAYKAIEQKALINPIGSGAEALVSGIIGKAMGGISMGSKVAEVANIAADITAFSANILAQSVAETLLDDRYFVDKAIESGKGSDAFFEKLLENLWWNTIGEFSGFGSADRKDMSSKLGKLIQGASVKGLALRKELLTGLGYKVAAKLTKFNPEIGASGKIDASGKNIARMHTALLQMKHRANKLVRQIPLLREMTEEQKAVVDAAWGKIILGEEGAKSIENLSDLEKAVDDFEKAMKPKAGTGSFDNIASNLKAQQKAIAIRANLEVQISNIRKGSRAKEQIIKSYAGQNYKDFIYQQKNVAELEHLGIKEGRLTPKEGGTSTKEVSEYISYRSQELRVKNTIGKKAGAKEYYDGIQKKLKELSGKMGPELTEQADKYLGKMAAFNAAIDNYMIANEYSSKDYAELVNRLRESGDWGKGGSRYTPTLRLMDTDDATDELRFAMSKIESPEMFRTKMVGDDAKSYKYGELEQSFVDPALVLYGKLRTASNIAQATDMSRAVSAVSTPTRAISGFSEDGVGVTEKTFIQKTIGAMQKELDSAFSKNSPAFKEAFRKSFGESDAGKQAAKEVLKSKKAIRAEGEQDKLLSSMEKSEKEMDRILFGSKSEQNLVIDRSSNEEVAGLIAIDPKDTPDFSITDVRGKDGFKEWKEKLPGSTWRSMAARLKRMGYSPTLANVRRLSKLDPDFVSNIQRNYIKSADGIDLRKTEEYRNFITFRRNTDLKGESLNLYNKEQKAYLKAKEKLEAPLSKETKSGLRIDPKNYETFSKNFSASVDAFAEETIDKMGESLLKNDSFKILVGKMVEAGASEDDATRYVILHYLSKQKPGTLTELLRGRAETAAKAAGGKRVGSDIVSDARNAVVDAVMKKFQKEYGIVLGKMVNVDGVSEAVDIDDYWNLVKKYHNDIMAKEGKYLQGESLNDFDRAHIVQMVDGNGEIKYYEVDPTTAFVANNKINFNRTGDTSWIRDRVASFNRNVNMVFRWGTTGIDRISYTNQWIKDSLSAVMLGGARPFTDLGVSNPATAMLSDYLPFGKAVFGKNVTSVITDKSVAELSAPIKKALTEQYGSKWVDDFLEQSSRGLSGEAAKAAEDRAITEFYIRDNGFASLPNAGGVTQAEYFRATEKGVEEADIQEVRREMYALAYGEKEGKKELQKIGEKMKKTWDDFFENTSRGNWRETYARQSVYATQFNTAIKAGMTPKEASIWAERYALDATTDFGRMFAIGNDFIRNVPYLSAALNGSGSFWRLLEMDPVGVSSRIAWGVIMPYMTLLSESLGSEENRKAYESIREYEKDSSMVLAINGNIIKVPLPQEIGKILNPFRHAVESMVGAQNGSFFELAASDALGLMPLDLSGFVDLDANAFLEESDAVPFPERVQRGLEKALSSLMSPMVKTAWMQLTGRDPYTGQDIDKSYWVLLENGEWQQMDYSQSNLAKQVHKWFPDVSASAAEKCLNGLFGRSTISVFDGVAETFSDIVEGKSPLEIAKNAAARHFDKVAEQFMDPVTVSEYDTVKTDWQRAINVLYDAKGKMENDEQFRKALTTIRNTNSTDAQRESAWKVYNEKVNDFYEAVFNATSTLKKKYPEHYNVTRVKQIISLLTLDSGAGQVDTPYSSEVSQAQYKEARAQALNTFLRMGFPNDYAGTNALGVGSFNEKGEYEFKPYTPYQIEYIDNLNYAKDERIAAEVRSALDDAGINVGDMWDGYYNATTTTERKNYKRQWNAQVVNALYPTVERYGASTVIESSGMTDVLDNYIFVDNPYKTKQYLYSIFEGEL